MTRVPPPSQLFVEVTSNCNLTCPHCYVKAGVGRLRQLDFETVNAAVDEFKAMGGERFTLSGGEPTLHKRWHDMLDAGLDAGLMTEIISNGTRLLDRDLDFLAEREIGIDISMESADAERHDVIRGEGSFARTVASIDRLLDRGLGDRITLCISPMRHNWDQIEALHRWAELRGVARVYVSLLEDRGRATEQDEAIGLDDVQKLRLIETVVAIMARPGGTALEVPNLRYFPERVLGGIARVEAIDRTLRLTAEGDMFLTAYLDAEPFQLGRYLPGNLSTSWNSAKVERAILGCKARETLIPACRSCGIFDLCQSGSAMFAWSKARGFFDVDGYCTAKRTYTHHLMTSMIYEQPAIQHVG